MPSLWWGTLLLPLGVWAWRRPVGLPLAFLVAGVFWTTLQADWVLSDALPSALERRDLQLRGVVADIPQPTERGMRLLFDVTDARFQGKAVAVPRRIILSSYGEQSFNVGEHWQVVARLKRPHGFQNPGGFDYERYLFQSRIRATGYIRAQTAPQQLPGWSLRYAVDRWRQYLGGRIRAVLGAEPLAGIVVALANGDKRGISDSQWNVFRRTGTNHLMAISGLHIGLVAGFAFFMVRWLWAWPGFTVLRWPAPKVAAVGAMAAAAVYAALAGFSIPTQRALIMITVAMGAVLMQRRVATSQLLAIALLLVLLYDPLAALSAGFWLSFTAVAVIVLFLNARQRRGIDWRNLGRLQWGIAIGLLPLLLLFFQQVSLVGPLANLFAVPLFGLLVVPFTLAGTMATMLLPDVLTAWLFQLALWALKLVWVLLDYLAGLRYSVWTQQSPGLWALAFAVVGVFLLLAPRGWPARWLGAVWLLPMLTLKPTAPMAGSVWFTLLDVGHGLAAVVRTQSHTLVYDTGARFSARFDAGRAVVVPYLRHQGVSSIDTLIVSHGDNDHIGGAASVLADVKVGRTISSVPERLPMAEVCIAGLQWRWDDVQFKILHPPAGSDLRGNNASCVLKVSGRYGSILLPGDIEARAEKELVEREREALASQVLVVPHQGSKTSSTPAFVRAVAPQLVLFSTGYRNPFKHPHAQVKARYKRYRVRLYDSPVHGAVEVRLSEDGTEVRSYRQHNRRYWFNQPSP